MSYFKTHLFICTNQKPNGKKCCEADGASLIWQYIKQKVEDLGLAGPGGVRVSRSGCLGRCEVGPCLVIYPQGEWYSYESEKDIDEILEQVLLQGNSVPRLRI